MKLIEQAPSTTYHQIDLPQTSLHYLMHGKGPPLLIVPATMSEIDSWLNLIHFMGQRYKVYFFELPGHGKSSPFPHEYSSKLVATMVKEFVDLLDIPSFTLMGFSFGGLLTLEILRCMPTRVSRLLLYSPFVDFRAIKIKLPINVLRVLLPIFFNAKVSRGFSNILHNQTMLNIFLFFLQKAKVVEHKEIMYKRLFQISPKTLEALAHQFYEMITADYLSEGITFNTPCHFGMSVNDPLLDFDIVNDSLNHLFVNLNTEIYNFPFHQPPKQFTIQKYNTIFKSFLDF